MHVYGTSTYTFTTKNQLIVGKYIIEWMAWGKKSLKKALFPGRVLFFGGDRLSSAPSAMVHSAEVSGIASTTRFVRANVKTAGLGVTWANVKNR